MFLCYNKPAHMSYLGWENEALPLGNGKIGVKVFGGVQTELVHFNEKTLWSGGSEVEGYTGGVERGDKGKSFREIQALLSEGNSKKAEEKMKNLQGDMTGFGAYQSFGNLYFSFENHEESEKYVRDLDLDSASAMVTYKTKKGSYTRHYFVSYPDNVFVARLQAEGEDATLDFSAYIVSEQKGTVKAEKDTLSLYGSVKANDGLEAKDGKDKNSMKYGGFLKIICDGETEAKDGLIAVKGATEALVIMSLATNYVNNYPCYFSDTDPLEQAKEKVLQASEKGFALLYKTHLTSYRELYDRVKFSLGEEESVYPTDFILKRFEKKGEFKRNLITTLFQYGRYLLISSSREGSLPANLQGIWNAKNNPPWCCDYHFNVNIQMNYWSAYTANLAETALPYIDFVNSLKKPGRIAANKILGIGENKADGEPDTEKETGWLIHTMVNPLGFVGPGSDWRWGWAPTNGAWALQGMYDYYLFTKDGEKLKNDIYPAMQECALLWSQILTEDKESGRLVCSPGFSPEHGPLSKGITYDQCIIYNLYEDVLSAAEEMAKLGFESEVNKELVAKIKEQIIRLRPLHKGKWGQIKEWYEEDSFFMRGFKTKGVQKKHRHISQLLALYPFKQISPDDEVLSKAAYTTLKDRGDKSTGWGLAIRLLSLARLGKGNDCDTIIENIMKTAVLKNLFGTHPPFQIDGNFGFTAGVCEMLLQSHEKYIRVLPALPESWKTGEISGIMARGGFEFSLKWDNGILKSGSVLSKCGGKCAVKYDGKILIVTDEEGKELETEFENGVTTFETEEGKRYSFI